MPHNLLKLVGRSALAAAAAVGTLAWATPAQAEAARPGANAADDEERFLRYRDMRNGGVLETTIVRYQNDAGDTVDLIGAVHVGDQVYYDLLNERFAGYDALLYEMVKPRGHDFRNPQPRRAAEEQDSPFAMQLIGGLQKALQLALELDYQTQRIDYTPDNFVHADLYLEDFMRLQEERGEGFLDLIIKQMMRDLTNPQARQNQPQVSLIEIMDAMNAPDRARRLKLLFARELSNMGDLTSVFESGGDDSVILGERNRKAVAVMDDVLERRGMDNLGIFYGAAHMPGIERLLEDRGFKQVGEPEYLIAWDMTLDGSGRREMRERTRNAIVENVAGNADEGPAAVAALRAENERLRKLNDALRRQVEAMQAQIEAEQAGN
ncbi:MAG: hypothetical protein AAGI46_15810 [Planctomycetota bacterium]